MQLNDLLVISNYLGNLNKENNFASLFDQVGNCLSQISSKPNEQQHRKRFQEDLAKLKEALRKIKISKQWSLARVKLFKKFCGSERLGEEAVESIDKIINENHVNPAGMRDGILKLKKDVVKVLERSGQLKSGLQPLIDEYEDDQALEENEMALQVVFDKDINIEDIHQLAKNTKDWDDVFHYITIISETPEKKPRIISVEKGSFIIEVAATSGTIYLIGKTFHVIMGCAKQWYEVKKAKRQSEKAGLEVEAQRKINEIYDHQLERLKESTESKVEETLIEELNLDSEDGSRNKAAKKIAQKLLKFVLGGGSIDIRKPSKDEDEGESSEEEGHVENTTNLVVENIKKEFDRLRELERRFGELPQLPHLFEDEDEDPSIDS